MFRARMIAKFNPLERLMVLVAFQLDKAEPDRLIFLFVSMRRVSATSLTSTGRYVKRAHRTWCPAQTGTLRGGTSYSTKLSSENGDQVD
jgi:hypothetical protein